MCAAAKQEFRRMATVKSVTNRSIGLRSGVRGIAALVEKPRGPLPLSNTTGRKDGPSAPAEIATKLVSL